MTAPRLTVRREPGAVVIRGECAPGVAMTPERSVQVAEAAVVLLNQVARDHGHAVTYRVTDLRWRDDGEEYVEIRLPLRAKGRVG